MPVMTTCPHCRQPLRVADDQVGRHVRCPACKTVFAAGIDRSGVHARPERSPDLRAAARARTRLPGLGLLVNGLLTTLIYGSLGTLVLFAAVGRLDLPQAVEQRLAMMDARQWPMIKTLQEEDRPVAEVIIVLVAAVIGTGVGIGMIRAGVRMRRLRGYGSAVVWSVASMLPCTVCLWGLPFGLWALMVLSDPAVKQAFES
jgi:predicted Zn finger-like uncharacterized protein